MRQNLADAHLALTRRDLLGREDMYGAHAARHISGAPAVVTVGRQGKLPEEADQLIFPIDDVTRDRMADLPPHGQDIIVDAGLQGLAAAAVSKPTVA